MSFDAEDYVARVLEEDPLPVVDADSSKWVAVHDARDPSVPTSGGPGSLFTVAWVLGIGLGLIWVLRNGRTVFEQWQENVHRRANRRRHGIPDNDDRPFNVAYAAAALARRQREERERKRVDPPSRHEPDDSERGHKEPVGLRQRVSQPAGSASTPFVNSQPSFLQGSSKNSLGNKGFPLVDEEHGTHSIESRLQPSTDHRMVQAYDWSDSRNKTRLEDHADQPQLPVRSSSIERSSRRHLDVNGAGSIPAERRKHHELDEPEDEDRSTKKSRVAADGDIDGHNDPPWANMPGGSRRGSLQVVKRGSKRHANEEADDDWEMSQDKRARKGSLPHVSGGSIVDVDMDHDDSGTDSGPARGQKRDREDAESLADSAPYDADASPPTRRARKRRAGRKDELVSPDAPRGQKRDRSQERSVSSDEEGMDDGARTTRHKRNRRLEEDPNIVPGDASESEVEVSSDPACGGRMVGETWEVNGQSFKVGLDGRRLRHALIKQSRTKFPMPKDSAHRDARTNVDVIVEKWLNDDEYKVAKEKQELAWQDASPASTPDRAPVSARQEELPSSGGKRLLWGGPPPSPVKGRSSMHSASTIQNPFDLAPSNSGRRVASAQLLNNKVESPKLRNSKSFSKWEKQDLEASSLKKMRARMEKQKAEAAATSTVKSPAAPAPTPLTSTTNTQSQAPPVLPNLDPPKSSIPSPIVQSTTSSANPFAKPETGAHVAPTTGFSLGTPTSTLSNNSTKPSGALALSAAPQNQASAPAQTTSTSPFATGGSTQPATQKPSLIFGPPGVVPPSSSTPIASPTTSKPPLLFGSSPSEAAKNTASKPSFSFGVNTGSTPSSEPGKGGIPNFFAKPASQPPAIAAPASTGTGAFTFNPGSQAVQSNPPPKPSFQFGTTGGQRNTSSSVGTAPAPNRIAQPHSSQLPQSNAAQNFFSSPLNSGKTASSQSPFGKPNPTTSQSPSSNPFGQQGAQSQVQPSSPNPFGQQGAQQGQQNPSKPTLFGQGANTAEAPKSNPFGGPSATTGGFASPFTFPKPSGQTDASARPAAPTSSFPAAQPGQPQLAPSKPTFSFNFGGSNPPGGTPQASANTSTPASNTGQPANPLNPTNTSSPGFNFSFGGTSTSSNPNPFGGFGTKPADSGKK